MKMASGCKKLVLDIFDAYISANEKAIRNLGTIYEIAEAYVDNLSTSNDSKWKNDFDKLCGLLGEITQISDKLQDLAVAHDLDMKKMAKKEGYEAGESSKTTSSTLIFVDGTYCKGYSGECKVTHVCTENDEFFINDISKTKLEDLRQLEEIRDSIYKNRRINDMPKPGVIYGLQDANLNIERVVIDSFDTHDVLLKAFFLDIGETKNLDRKCIIRNLYELDEKYRKMPPFAIRCILNFVNGSPIKKPSIFLQEHLNKKINFNVDCVTSYQLVINLITKPMAEKSTKITSIGDTSNRLSEKFENPVKLNLSFERNVFDNLELKKYVNFDRSQELDTLWQNNKEKIIKESPLPKFRPAGFHEEVKQISPRLKSIMKRKTNNLDFWNNDEFSRIVAGPAEEYDEETDLLLQNNEQNLSDAEKSFQIGIQKTIDTNPFRCKTKSIEQNLTESHNVNEQKLIPSTDKDDNLISLADPENQNTFMKLEKDGFGNGGDDQVSQDISNKFELDVNLNLPKVGDCISIMPTHLEDVNFFYGQIVSELNNFYNNMSLKEIHANLNAPEKVHLLRTVRDPVKNQLVIAKFKDGHYYRAKIMQVFEIGAHVWFVDYGNLGLTLSVDIKYWDAKYDKVPFQAVAFQIGNIEVTETQNIRAITNLKKKILCCTINADILEVFPSQEGMIVPLIKARFTDTNRNDIGELLVSKNFAVHHYNKLQ